MLWWLIFLLLWAEATWALPPEYEILIEKNPFSPERQYVPTTGQGTTTSTPRSKEDLKKELILRGTFESGNLRLAVIEVRSSFKRRHQLEKDRYVVGEGEKIGPCEILEVRRGEVEIGGECQNTVLSLADAPERKKPLTVSPTPPPTRTHPSTPARPVKPKPASTKTNQKPSKFPKPPNPFEKAFQQKGKTAP